MEEECLAQGNAYKPGRAYHFETHGLSLDPKMVADAVKEELIFMRRLLHVHREFLVSHLDKSGLNAIETRWVTLQIHLSEHGWLHKRVSELTLEDASGAFAATPPPESCKVQTTSARVGAQCWTEPRLERQDAAQCFDVASENARTVMEFTTGTFSLCLYHHSSAADMSVLRHGDVFVVSGTRTQQKQFEEQWSKRLIVKHLATLGPCTALGNVTEVTGSTSLRIGTRTH